MCYVLFLLDVSVSTCAINFAYNYVHKIEPNYLNSAVYLVYVTIAAVQCIYLNKLMALIENFCYYLRGQPYNKHYCRMQMLMTK